MAEIAGWFTVGGRHIPYMVGQSKAEAAKAYMNSKHGKDVARLSSKTYTKKKEASSGNKQLDNYRNMNAEEVNQLSSKLFSQKSSEIFDEGLNGNSDYQKVVRELGLNDKPKVLSEKEFNNQIKDNTPIYRGVKGTTKWDGKDYVVDRSGEDIVSNIKYGDKTYIGTGIYGDGIYFTDSHSAANKYAGLNSKAIATAFIDKSKSKIIDQAKLKDMRTEYFKANPTVKQNGIFSDLSSFALYKGYNVISVNSKETEGNGNYYNVLDRSILVMKE